ncbi:MAG: DUF6398 domain-containing protein [Methanobrevibacter sp.]|nr:DUF6398 domain-containing protein [Methanobrevibacter sp.]
MAKEEVIIEKEEQLLKMVHDFSEMFLDDECCQLCSNIVKKLGRKREVPFKRGKLTIWASAMIHVVAHINFLFDKKFTPHITMDDICDYFNTKKSTIGSKSQFIRSSLKIKHFNFEFTQKKLLEEYLMSCSVESDEGIRLPIANFEKKSQRKLIDSIIENKGKNFKIIKPILPPYFYKLNEAPNFGDYL